jgi:hypothetical protein
MKNILKNIKTTFVGSIAGLGFIIDGIQTKNWTMAISGLATVILGLLAKDSDVH